MTTPRLSVTISTFGLDGIRKVVEMRLPQVRGVEYVVSWQLYEGPIPRPLLKRHDVTVVRTPSIGLSENRNNAIIFARGEIILLADDDLRYTPEQLNAVIDTFDANPKVDIASFRFSTPLYKTYPSEPTPFGKLPKGFTPASVEIAFRREVTEEPDGLKFNPLMGLGAPYLRCGEEDLFLMQATARGYNGKYFPITITTHTGVSTGERKITDQGTLRGHGACIALRRGWMWPAAVIINAMRVSRAGRAGFLTALTGMAQGAIYAMRNRKHLIPEL